MGRPFTSTPQWPFWLKVIPIFISGASIVVTLLIRPEWTLAPTCVFGLFVVLYLYFERQSEHHELFPQKGKAREVPKDPTQTGLSATDRRELRRLLEEVGISDPLYDDCTSCPIRRGHKTPPPS